MYLAKVYRNGKFRMRKHIIPARFVEETHAKYGVPLEEIDWRAARGYFGDIEQPVDVNNSALVAYDKFVREIAEQRAADGAR